MTTSVYRNKFDGSEMLSSNRNAGLDVLRGWEPTLSDAIECTDKAGNKINATGLGQVSYRSDTNAPLGVVGPIHSLGNRPNADLIELFERLQDRGDIESPTVSLWRNRIGTPGAIVNVSARLIGAAATINGKVIRHGISVLDFYGGGGSKCLMDRDVNLACQNQFFGAMKNATVKLRHTASIERRFVYYVELLSQSRQRFDKNVEAWRSLASKPAGFTDLRSAMDRFFPLPTKLVRLPTDKADTSFDRRHANVQETRNRIAQAYEFAPGAAPGSRFGIYQAFTYWLTHEQGRSKDRQKGDELRERSNLIGPNAQLNRQVLGYLLN